MEQMGEVMNHFANVVFETVNHLQRWAELQCRATQHQIAVSDPHGDFGDEVHKEKICLPGMLAITHINIPFYSQ